MISKQIKISKDHLLCIEKDQTKARLVIRQADQELVCRKERITVLEKFMTSDQQHLFKGRLQLNKKMDKIYIIVKNECIGTISMHDLQQWIK